MPTTMGLQQNDQSDEGLRNRLGRRAAEISQVLADIDTNPAATPGPGLNITGPAVLNPANP